MKQKDIALIIAVIFFSAIVSVIVTQTFFVPKKAKQLTAETVDPISSEFKDPDKAVFNKDALNPTQLIQIGDNGTVKPF